MKALLDRTCHIEVCRGSQAKNITYCTKADTRIDGPWTAGIKARSGDGTLKVLTEWMMEERTVPVKMAEIVQFDPVMFVKHHSGLSRLRQELIPARTIPPIVKIFYGPTGTGKSMCARAMHPDYYVVDWPDKGVWWWQNYQQQDTVIMDEFRHQIKFDRLLGLLDRYEFNAQVKYGSEKFFSPNIVITTNIHPKDWYAGLTTEVKDPLKRRLKEHGQRWRFYEKPEKINADDVLRKHYVKVQVSSGEWFKVKMKRKGWENFEFINKIDDTNAEDRRLQLEWYNQS